MDEKSEEVMPELVNQYILAKDILQNSETKSSTTEEKNNAQKQVEVVLVYFKMDSRWDMVVEVQEFKVQKINLKLVMGLLILYM